MSITPPQVDPGFQFPGTDYATVPQATPAPPIDLGPLTQLEGLWVGEGFNTIWRPFQLSAGQDRFLELNLTTETLAFTKINGAIPNRGLVNQDINMFGLTYLQQISQKEDGAGLHIEPGIWASVPATDDPKVPASVVRMASIPHGTVICAQGNFLTARTPRISDNNILPFPIGGVAHSNADFDVEAKTFTELDLTTPTQFRFMSPGVTQDMVKNPNSVLTAAIAGQNITSTTVLIISTLNTAPPGGGSFVPGGGTANTAFLQDATDPAAADPTELVGNANAAVVSAIFWIETVADVTGGPDILQLQYTQTVELDFNGLRWPHVTVATLRKVA